MPYYTTANTLLNSWLPILIIDFSELKPVINLNIMNPAIPKALFSNDIFYVNALFSNDIFYVNALFSNDIFYVNALFQTLRHLNFILFVFKCRIFRFSIKFIKYKNLIKPAS